MESAQPESCNVLPSDRSGALIGSASTDGHPYRTVFIACATAFLASGCVMIVELLAGRLIAPYLGTSLYTWTSVIGVVLGGLALGNYVGGRLADRFPTTRALSACLVAASASCVLVAVLNHWSGEWPALWLVNMPQRIAVHVTLTFGPAAAVLGTIGPLVAKMALDAGRRVGRTVGSVYAWGSLGSIVGTFACGFFLIAALGAYTVLYAVAAVLAAMAVAYGLKFWLPYVWCVALAAVLFLAVAPSSWVQSVSEEAGLRDERGPGILFDRDSQYAHVRVTEASDRPGMRVMLLDKLIHSQFDVRHPNELAYGYERIYAAVTDVAVGSRDDINVLILGGGGFTHPRYLMRRRPGSHVRVVEIDPVVTQAAKEAFGLPEHPPFEIIHLDARQVLVDLVNRKRAGERVPAFDLVFLDAVNDYNVPFHLTTVECQALVKELLSPNGVYAVNLIDIFREGAFLAAMLQTLEQSFKYTTCFRADDEGGRFDQQSRNTFVLVASDRGLQLDKMAGSPLIEEVSRLRVPDEMLAELRQRTKPQVLIDEHAPVENLLAAVVQRAGDDAHFRYYNRGNRQLAKGRLEQAETSFRKAIELRPDFSMAYMNLGDTLVEQGRLPEAMDCFQEAAELSPYMAEPLHNVGSVYMRMHDYERAAEMFRRCIQMHPDYANGYNSLGMAVGNLGELEEAAAAFRKALELNPDHPQAAENLARVEAAMQQQAPSSRDAATTAEVGQRPETAPDVQFALRLAIPRNRSRRDLVRGQPRTPCAARLERPSGLARRSPTSSR